MKKSLPVILCALIAAGCDSTKTYDITGHAMCRLVDNAISCTENDITIPDGVVTDMYTDQSVLVVHTYNRGIIICDVDLQNATDVCRDERGNLLNGILKNYDAESGDLVQQSTYVDGKSTKTINYHGNGAVASESTPDGTLRAYNEDGQLIYTTEMSADTITLKEYDADGNMVNTETISR